MKTTNGDSAMMRSGLLLTALFTFTVDVRADTPRDALWAAVRNSDVKAIEAAIEKGADVNATNEIGITALWIAGGKGKLDVIEALLKHGADPSARDLIWYQTPLSSALGAGNVDVVKALLKAGAKDGDAALLAAVGRSNVEMTRAILEAGKPPSKDVLAAALFGAPRSNEEIQELLKKAGAEPLPAASEDDKAKWKPLAGVYESDNGSRLVIAVREPGLVISSGAGGTSARLLQPTGPDAFQILGVASASVAFERKDGTVSRVVVKRFTAESSYFVADSKPTPKPVGVPSGVDDGTVAAPMNWPSFRGPEASGVADGQRPPVTWDVEKGDNVRWKTPIPGLGHSCPVIWGDRVFLTSAISGDPDPKIRTGNYGDVDSVNDTTKHSWRVYCLDRESGKILWEHTAYEGVPKSKRHLKGSQANCTPATDGKRMVACFGPEGLYCYDFTGKLLWTRDLGNIDSSFTMDREYEWGFAASPIIHDGLVILQCDLSKDSFIAAYSLEDGSRVWSTPRDEIPTWSSPTIWRTPCRVEIVTNGSQFARGYDPATGRELWRLAKKSEASIPTPIAGPGMVLVTSGNRPIQPIFAIRPGATGDLSFDSDEKRGSHIAWSRMRGGPYMTTPIVYGEHFYTCTNTGFVTCYEATSGKEVYKERLGGVSYTASPVAADGRLYFISEQGQVRVVKAGPKFELLAVNDLGDVCLASPAISNGSLFVRTQHYLWSLGKK
jgi:outer membrane protein assembly factor BamB